MESTVETPWVMQIVVRAERGVETTEHDVLVATSSAFIAALTDAAANRYQDESVLHRFEAWYASNIRKVVRRARGSAWDKAAALSGSFVSEHNGAMVAVLLPAPVNETPSEVRRLQVSGLELSEVDTCEHLPSDTNETELAVLEYAFNPELEMSYGKKVAQFAHLVQYGLWGYEAFGDSTHPLYQAWKSSSYATRVVEWGSLNEDDYSVRDAGYTEVPANSCTIRGRWVYA